MKAIGVTDFLSRSFATYPFEGKWLDTFGEVEKNFKMLVYGHPKNGKTEFCLQLAKYLAGFTKVYYNSFEQGISKTLKDALIRNNMQDVSGKIIFGNRETVSDMHARLASKNAPQIVIIDSRDYLNMTTEQFKSLIEAHPRKGFIIICWESAQKPKGEYAKAMEFMVDIVVRVNNYKAYPRSRFGGNIPYVIWDRKPATGEQLKAF